MKMELGIRNIALQGISLIEERQLRQALESAYDTRTARNAASAAEGVFERLTSRQWSSKPLSRFLNGWRSTHVTALYVSGLMIRLLREASAADGEASELLFRAAAEVGEIIPEDTGVDDTPHGELYMGFAHFLLGHDRWQLARWSNPQCETFRHYVKTQRLEAEIEDAILTTAASENWNTGEYTHLTNFIRPWMIDQTGESADLVEENAENAVYVTVHAGQTELGHFLHALEAWQLYCRANGRPADPERARAIVLRYLDGVGQAFAALGAVFHPDRVPANILSA
jgi:hypothetical protein